MADLGSHIADQAGKTSDMLSGGQQQRVAIARALANNPPLVVGDEPTGNLHRMSADNVFGLFQQLADQGTTVIVVTHDRELVRNIPRLYELADGPSVPPLSKRQHAAGRQNCGRPAPKSPREAGKQTRRIT
jgi:ABC-type lipoprotein export system ATPase subunit